MKSLIVLLIIFSSLFSFEEKWNNETNASYINIISNVEGTKILIDGKEVGTTPINYYEVEPFKDITIMAIANKKYYKKDLKKVVKILKNTTPTYNFNFEKAKAKLFFVGMDGELYINDKFIRKLSSNNRTVKIDANKKTKIKLVNGYNYTILNRDIQGNNFYKIKYDIEIIPKDIRLSTLSIENLMWEDTPHAKNVKINWENADEYCKFLRIGDFKDWKMPTFEQLKDLQENNKDDIYNGHGEGYYWSTKSTSDYKKIWNYSDVIEFKLGKTQRFVKELETGYIRCVREIKKDIKEKTKDKI